MPLTGPRLGYRVRMLSKAIDGLIGEHLERAYGLTLREGLLLVTLRRDPATHAQDLAQMTAIDKSQVSRAVETLVQRGWIAPLKAESDQRFKTYRISVEGAALADAVAADLQAFNRQALGALDAAEREQLFALLDRVTANVRAPRSWSDAAEPVAVTRGEARLGAALHAWPRRRFG